MHYHLADMRSQFTHKRRLLAAKLYPFSGSKLCSTFIFFCKNFIFLKIFEQKRQRNCIHQTDTKMLPLFGNIYNLHTSTEFWQQKYIHFLAAKCAPCFQKKIEILFFREIIFGWAAPSTSELRRVGAASWPPFRQTVLAGFAPPFAGRWRALPALRIHKMLHHRVHRHMHVHTHARG